MADIHPGQLRRWIAELLGGDCDDVEGGPTFIVIKVTVYAPLAGRTQRDWKVMGSGGRVFTWDEDLILKYSEVLDE